MNSIISWNVNGIRAVEKKGFLEWLNKESPDILCLQETKAKKEQLSAELVEADFGNSKYFTFWQAAKKAGYSGTAIYSKKKPLEIRTMNLPQFDDEGRVLAADYDGFSVVCAYFPNSQDGGARLGYKLEFCDAILEFCNSVHNEKHGIILCGDYNIAHKPIDLARPKANENSPGYLPEERAWMEKFISSGYKDTFRTFCAEPEMYTWWSYRFKAREKNIGWRIDYHCVNESFSARVQDSVILKDISGSDHCPIKLIIK